MSGLWEMVMKMASDKAGQFGKQASSFGDKVANPSQAVQQYGQQMQQPQPQQGGGKWQKYAGSPQDTSVGMSAAQQQDPMYSQMMQQVMQNQPQQQRQPMTSVGVAQLPQTGIPQATMPQMPGAIHPNEDMMSLLKRLMGGA